MKIFRFIFSCFVLLCFLSCRNDPDGQNGSHSDKVIPREQIQLVCEAVDMQNTQEDTPQHEVFIYLDETKIKVADILNCNEITSDQYEQYQIPQAAIVAVGGWWAGAGDYIYIIEEDEKFVVRQGEMYEEKEEPTYDYKTVLTFDKSGNQVL